jgi:hypothetical protein
MELKTFIVVNTIDPPCVILSDYNYWSDAYERLEAWVNTHDSKLEGMCLTFPDEETKMLFILEWA